MKTNRGRRLTYLIAIETKQWIDDKGRAKSKAGFAKVSMGAETKKNTKEFVEQSIRITSELHTDQARA